MVEPEDRSRRPPTIVVSDEQSDVVVDVDRWRGLAAAVLTDLGVTHPTEVGLTFVDRETITALNRTHMGSDRPTDVLSFPIDDPGEADDAPTLLGDVVICPEVADHNAPDHAGTLEDELALLLVHGLLHLRGHDHAEHDDAVIMRDREASLLAAHHRPLPVGTELPQVEPS